jgi:hypothetical protein
MNETISLGVIEKFYGANGHAQYLPVGQAEDRPTAAKRCESKERGAAKRLETVSLRPLAKFLYADMQRFVTFCNLSA